ncbi:serine hydrolase domain-containing protein [Limnofasciculus baicalensis]|uniref:Beta-lactamase family protein n=1 Tax=Limnofasciculus baicalensis BBK-W-15 TaxID=2699891 RepID=A0AAE3GW02_9CYAN|nr:serine hydrolase domain-containing protein [Limnofasciculus baicalensis]MCP2731711.1 beta-lactamase family protein [Limnofasciculus baicalensis BBK-W-15]
MFSQQIISDLQQVLNASVADQGIPGAVVYLSTTDGIWSGASGVSNLKTNTPMKPRDRFRIGSISKLFLAVVILQLMEEDKIDLNDTLIDWLSEEICDFIPNSHKITIRQLLNHTSGLADYLNTDEFNTALETTNPNHLWTATEAITYAYDLEPLSPPGKKFHYSNPNYILLELIVEAVTENTLAREMCDRIHTPLGLIDTFTEMREEIPGGFVEGYADWDEDGETDNVTRRNDGVGLGDGGLISTAPDVARFIQGLFIEDKLLAAETLEKMLTWVEDREGGYYGLGISAWNSDWGEIWGHTGNTGGFLSTCWFLPNQDITVVVLTNTADTALPDDIAAGVLDVVLADEEED